MALPRHHRGCAGGGLPIRCGPAQRGRRGTSSTPQGVRWGWQRPPTSFTLCFISAILIPAIL
eukprot:7465711-Pyramimonas_sp.AAC.1